MILAGYSGAGKTSLTCFCLKNRVPLFGQANADIFFNLQIPPRFPEWRMDVQTIIKNRHWFSTPHLAPLHELDQHPDSALIHFDLLTLIKRKAQITPGQSAAPAQPRSFDSLRNVEENVAAYAESLANNRFLLGFEQVIINTLYVPYDQNCRQWHMKRRKSDVHRGAIFFNPDAPEEKIHQAAYEAWQIYASTRMKATLLKSRVEDGKLHVSPEDAATV